MELLKAYKVIPMQGNIVRLYEFGGRYDDLVDPARNAGQHFKRNPTAKLKYIGVLAESLYDAVIHLRLLCPRFSPDRVMERGEVKVEIPQSQRGMLPEMEDAT
jgi:hypothetical protein